MNKNKTTNIGVIGVGFLGNYHVQQLQNIPNVNLVGVYDLSFSRASEIGDKYKVKTYTDFEELLDECDAVSVVTPTSTHFEIANRAIQKNCHVFIEKPITKTTTEAKSLLKLSKENRRIIQVGHIEQFNPAFLALDKESLVPEFIESHRLSPFNIRGTDVPVVLDLMIHDIGIILSLVKQKVSSVQANGVSVVSETADIATARIEFNGGCVANLTASRISQKKMRKLRIFQRNNYTTIDFLLVKTETYNVVDEISSLTQNEINFELKGHEKKQIVYRNLDIKDGNALHLELSHFVNAIQNSRQPTVDGYGATETLQVALQIQKIIDES